MGYKNRVYKVIEESDIVLELLDARFPELTRHKNLEKKVLNSKPLLLVLNKSDLVSKNFADKQKNLLRKEGLECVFISASKKLGMARLKKIIFQKIKKGKIGIVGYPNVGKSSIINALSGRSSAGTSRKAGYTRGEKLIKLKADLYLLDSPGIFAPIELKEFEAILTSSKNPDQLKDLEVACLDFIDYIVENNEPFFEREFGIKEKDSAKILEQIGILKKKLKKGNKVDMKAAAAFLITQYQKGKLNVLK